MADCEKKQREKMKNQKKTFIQACLIIVRNLCPLFIHYTDGNYSRRFYLTNSNNFLTENTAVHYNKYLQQISRKYLNHGTVLYLLFRIRCSIKGTCIVAGPSKRYSKFPMSWTQSPPPRGQL